MKEPILTADKMVMDATTDLYDLRRFTVRLWKEPEPS